MLAFRTVTYCTENEETPSPNTAILHDKAAVSGAAVGQAGTLRYQQGQAQLASSQDQNQTHTLSR